MKLFLILILNAATFFATNINADEAYNQALEELAKTKVAEIVRHATVQSAIKAQNTRHAGLSQADIDKLDKQWRAENKGSDKPLINATLSNSLSKYLSQVKQASDGLYTEIFIMDNKGLNVGQSDTTSDYWQGDEAKWKKTFLVGTGAIHIGKLKKDDSTQQIQVQLSVAISDTSANAVNAMHQGREKASDSVEHSSKVQAALKTITEIIVKISDMNMHIATAAEEQNQVTEEINRNVVNVHNLFDHSVENAHHSANAGVSVANLANELQSMIGQFKV